MEEITGFGMKNSLILRSFAKKKHLNSLRDETMNISILITMTF